MDEKKQRTFFFADFTVPTRTSTVMDLNQVSLCQRTSRGQYGIGYRGPEVEIGPETMFNGVF